VQWHAYINCGSLTRVAPHLVAHDAADADAAGLGQGFEASGDVDAVAEDVAFIDDDVAALLFPPLPGRPPISGRRPTGLGCTASCAAPM
jgi:hypothetical protein